MNGKRGGLNEEEERGVEVGPGDEEQCRNGVQRGAGRSEKTKWLPGVHGQHMKAASERLI